MLLLAERVHVVGIHPQCLKQKPLDLLISLRLIKRFDNLGVHQQHFTVGVFAETADTLPFRRNWQDNIGVQGVGRQELRPREYEVHGTMGLYAFRHVNTRLQLGSYLVENTMNLGVLFVSTWRHIKPKPVSHIAVRAATVLDESPNLRRRSYVVDGVWNGGSPVEPALTRAGPAMPAPVL